MEQRTLNQLILLNQHHPGEEILNNETKETQNQPNQNSENQLLNPEQLITKRSIILNGANNPWKEQDFRKTCSLFSNSNQELNEAYEGYVETYQKLTSLYLKNRDNLHIFDTESEKELKILSTPETLNYATCMTLLPNGEIFCFGKTNPASGITLVIGNDYRLRFLPSGRTCGWSSAIYLNKCVYCFGGLDGNGTLTLSKKFDFDKYKWVDLMPMPQSDFKCSSIIFNGNILISRYVHRNILVYSTDINSFSIIPYDFGVWKRKILINNEERLYLIECANGSIYESEVWDEYAWKWIAKSGVSYSADSVYWTYNKRAIYIGCIDDNIDWSSAKINYYKFNLDEKALIKLKASF